MACCACAGSRERPAVCAAGRTRAALCAPRQHLRRACGPAPTRALCVSASPSQCEGEGAPVVRVWVFFPLLGHGDCPLRALPALPALGMFSSSCRGISARLRLLCACALCARGFAAAQHMCTCWGSKEWVGESASCLRLPLARCNPVLAWSDWVQLGPGTAPQRAKLLPTDDQQVHLYRQTLCVHIDARSQ